MGVAKYVIVQGIIRLLIGKKNTRKNVKRAGSNSILRMLDFIDSGFSHADYVRAFNINFK